MVVSHCWRSIRFFQANESPQSQKDTKPKAFHWPSPQQWWNKCVWIIPLNKKNLSYLKKLFSKKKVHNSASQCVFLFQAPFWGKNKNVLAHLTGGNPILPFSKLPGHLHQVQVQDHQTSADPGCFHPWRGGQAMGSLGSLYKRRFLGIPPMLHRGENVETSKYISTAFDQQNFFRTTTGWD